MTEHTARTHEQAEEAEQPAGSAAGTASKDNAERAAGKADNADKADAQEVPGRLRHPIQHAKATRDVVFTLFGHDVSKTDIVKLVALALFLVLCVVVVKLAWPLIGDIFSDGGIDRLVERVQNAGVWGVFILLAFQILQVVVAFIPGEVVQLAAGMMYGPWLGTAILLVGCILSSAIIYQVVHRLGQPFVEDMVSTEHLEKFRSFEKSGKLDVMVFILFLIPGLPKDTFSYLVPLTEMPCGRYLAITTVARIPGMLASTFVAAGAMDGNIKSSLIIIVVVAVIALLAWAFRDKLGNLFHRGGES